MVNNAIDHSHGSTPWLEAEAYPDKIVLSIRDNGVGISHKIAKELDLHDDREAILELAKGKFTTDPSSHSGEGIFFTSRVFDTFGLISHDLSWVHDLGDDDWLIESAQQQTEGTWVLLAIHTDIQRTLQSVYDCFAAPEEYAFSKTHVPVLLAKYGDTQLISRSQAKRVLLRLDHFEEVFLDFKGAEKIGQAFADEIFRVFANAHSDIKPVYINTTPQIEAMINRARGTDPTNK